MSDFLRYNEENFFDFETRKLDLKKTYRSWAKKLIVAKKGNTILQQKETGNNIRMRYRTSYLRLLTINSFLKMTRNFIFPRQLSIYIWLNIN